ncbi:hypothetical protein XENOCAPTIV_015808 [Xenoophorus captivus]|uniref:Uncharacterized protein n=1 Tax=Xenoophorus captivus TaxID=1517983 RepID=A0ABV0R3X7_9TELE
MLPPPSLACQFRWTERLALCDVQSLDYCSILYPPCFFLLLNFLPDLSAVFLSRYDAVCSLKFSNRSLRTLQNNWLYTENTLNTGEQGLSYFSCFLGEKCKNHIIFFLHFSSGV